MHIRLIRQLVGPDRYASVERVHRKWNFGAGSEWRTSGTSVMLVVETDGAGGRVTVEAIRSRLLDVVDQGVFVDPDGWPGIADFVERQPGRVARE